MALDRRELETDPVTAMLAALDGRQSVMWTALPAIVLEFDPEERTASLQCAVQAQVLEQSGARRWVNLPPLVNCPVTYPGGRGLSLTFPLVPGDEVLVIFASRCIDNWWAQGGVQTQAELRMHDLSDGFCLPRPMSRPAALAEAPVSMDAAELRNADGTTKVRLMNTGDIEAVTPGAFRVEAESADITATSIGLNAPAIALNGNVEITGTLRVNGIDLGEDHTHSGVITGSDSTGGVVP